MIACHTSIGTVVFIESSDRLAENERRLIVELKGRPAGKWHRTVCAIQFRLNQGPLRLSLAMLTVGIAVQFICSRMLLQCTPDDLCYDCITIGLDLLQPVHWCKTIYSTSRENAPTTRVGLGLCIATRAVAVTQAISGLLISKRKFYMYVGR